MNDSLLKSDIFFFVSTLSVVALTVLMLIGLIYVVSILKTIKRISRTAQTGAETIVEGIQEAKKEVDKNGFVPTAITKIFSGIYKKSKHKK